jgi:transposase
LTLRRDSITKKSVTDADIAQLVTRLDEVERTQAKLQAERDQYRTLYHQMLERCRKLEMGLRNHPAERLPDGEQLSLGVLAVALGAQQDSDVLALTELDEVEQVREHTRRKPTGRGVIPEHLPRVDIEILPDEVKHAGLDAFERIGQEVTEVLERRPASLVVARVIKPKFVRKDRVRGDETEVFVGQTPELPIPRGLAGPGLLADTIVKRWQDHCPLHRLEGIYARDGVELARSTVCGWHAALAPLFVPLISAMRQDGFDAPYMCVDATGVLVQAKEKCRVGHFWVIVVPGRHVLFEYSTKHNNAAVDELLSGYQGYLVLDAHVVYDHLFGGGDVVEVNCWAHARRYFFKALGSDPERAKFALSHIGALFKIERSIATAPRKKRERIREKNAKPIVERFYSWCDAEWPKLLEDTPIYDGVRYARNQRVGLHRFLEDGRLPIHNNMSELELRRQAVGRKNWLFVGSDDGARVNATFTSLLASCQMHRVEPWSYLRDVLCLLPSWPAHRVLELAPLHWSATREADDVRQRLAADPYRALTLLG